MADLESMTPQERATFLAAQKLFGNKETRTDALRLVKKVDPTAHFAELDQEERISALQEDARKREAKLEEQILRERIERRQSERRNDLKARGIDAERIEKIIVEYGLAGDDKEDAFQKAEKIYGLESAQAESSAAAIETGPRAVDVRPDKDWKDLSKQDLMKKSANLAHEMIDEFKKARRAGR